MIQCKGALLFLTPVLFFLGPLHTQAGNGHGYESCKKQFADELSRHNSGRELFDVTGRWRLNHDYSDFSSFPLPIISISRESAGFRGAFVSFDDPQKPGFFPTKRLFELATSLAENVRLISIDARLRAAKTRFLVDYTYSKAPLWPISSGFNGEGSCCGIARNARTVSWDYCTDREAEAFLKNRPLKFRWERQP